MNAHTIMNSPVTRIQVFAVWALCAIMLLGALGLVALNKIDVPEARDLAELVTDTLRQRGYRVFPVSAASREGLRELSFAMAELVQGARASAGRPEPTRVVLRPRAVDERGFTVTVEGGQRGGADLDHDAAGRGHHRARRLTHLGAPAGHRHLVARAGGRLRPRWWAPSRRPRRPHRGR